MPIIQFFQKVFQEWSEDKVPRLAASLSYYTVFSLAPLLVVIIAVAGLVFGQDVAQQQIVAQVQGLIGPEGAALIDGLLTNARRLDTNVVALILGLGTIILGATGIVGELKDSLNTIWNVTPKPGRGLFGTFFERVLSFGMVLAIGFLLLVSLAISASLTALGDYVRGYFEQVIVLSQALDLIISLAIITVLFALIFKFLTDAKLEWRDVFVGAFTTAVLFTIGKYLIGLYLGNSDVGSPFGAAGSLVVLFVWVYYAAQILFLGAEITQVFANTYGAGVKPAEDAQKLSDAARVEQGTKAPTGAANTGPGVEAGAGAAAAPITPSAPRPTFQLRHPPFNLKDFLVAAVGVRFWSLIRRLFGQRPMRSNRN